MFPFVVTVMDEFIPLIQCLCSVPSRTIHIEEVHLYMFQVKVHRAPTLWRLHWDRQNQLCAEIPWQETAVFVHNVSTWQV